MYHEDIFYPFLPIFSTFDGKLVNVVENAECFCNVLFQFKYNYEHGEFSSVPITPHLNSWEFWTTSPMSRSMKKRTRATRTRVRMTIAPSGSEKMLCGPKKKMAPSSPPCCQQLSAQTKVHSKEKYEADIKKMISAARDGKRLRFATRITLGRNYPSKILPYNTPDYSMMFSAGPANSAMDPFARRKLRGSILARASVVSSRERSAATDEEKNNKTSLCKTCTNCDL